MTSIVLRRRRPRPAPNQRPRSYRPRIESLEGRITPTVSLTGVTTLPFAFTGGPEVTDGPVVDSSGNLYDTTTGGGGDTLGTVFQVNSSGQLGLPAVATLLASQQAGQPDSQLVIDSSGDLYGTTSNGGAFGLGSVFSITPAHGFQTLASFNDTSDDGVFPSGDTGSDPGDLLLDGGVLYGTATHGGANNLGTVFSVPVAGGPIQLVGAFDGTNGSVPNAGLILGAAILYGTTARGGAHQSGTVFSVPAARRHAITALASLTGAGFSMTRRTAISPCSMASFTARTQWMPAAFSGLSSTSPSRASAVRRCRASLSIPPTDLPPRAA